MNAHVKLAVVLVIGWGFIVLGILGLFLPVLPGILFLLVGLIILSSEYVWTHDLLNKLRVRYPKVGRSADEAAAKAHRWMHTIFRHRRGN
jgi:uncharacterized membrane protein YbaN (DUF454 family)